MVKGGVHLVKTCQALLVRVYKVPMELLPRNPGNYWKCVGTKHIRSLGESQCIWNFWILHIRNKWILNWGLMCIIPLRLHKHNGVLSRNQEQGDLERGQNSSTSKRVCPLHNPKVSTNSVQNTYTIGLKFRFNTEITSGYLQCGRWPKRSRGRRGPYGHWWPAPPCRCLRSSSWQIILKGDQCNHDRGFKFGVSVCTY